MKQIYIKSDLFSDNLMAFNLKLNLNSSLNDIHNYIY